jgi:coenzyme A transferase
MDGRYEVRSIASGASPLVTEQAYLDGARRGRRARVGCRGAVTAGRRTKVITPEAAARLIVDGDTLAVGGFVGIAVPEELVIALAKRFGETGARGTRRSCSRPDRATAAPAGSSAWRRTAQPRDERV